LKTHSGSWTCCRIFGRLG